MKKHVLSRRDALLQCAALGALKLSPWLSLTGAVGWEFAPALQTFLAVTRALPSDEAQTALPDSDYLEARAVVRVAF